MTKIDIASRSAVREWLTRYAWLGTAMEQARMIDCIMSQDGWRSIDVRADRYAGAQFEPGTEEYEAGIEFALSALYECHDGPHLPTCPHYLPEPEPGLDRSTPAEEIRAFVAEHMGRLSAADQAAIVAKFLAAEGFCAGPDACTRPDHPRRDVTSTEARIAESLAELREPDGSTPPYVTRHLADHARAAQHLPAGQPDGDDGDQEPDDEIFLCTRGPAGWAAAEAKGL